MPSLRPFLGASLTAPGKAIAHAQPACNADINGDSVVGSADLALLLSQW
jgi:hypothetical protein